MKRLLTLLAMLLLPGQAQAQAAFPAFYPEGPVWIDGTLYWAEMGGDRVMAWSAETAEPKIAWKGEGCGPTALARYQNDKIVVLCHLQGALAVMDADFNRIRTIDAATDGTRLRNPNDVSADGKGGIWFTDPGPFSKAAGAVGAVYHLDASGSLVRHVDGLFYGNGIFVDQTANRLLVSEHLARRILSYPLTPSGLGPAEVIVELDKLGLPAPRYDHSGPDGLEIGPGGVLWFAEYGTARLLGWDMAKGLVAATNTDAQFITNIAFGPDGLAAVTAPKNNTNPPFPGVVWIFKQDTLRALITE